MSLSASQLDAWPHYLNDEPREHVRYLYTNFGQPIDLSSPERPLLARDELGTSTLFFHPHGGRLGCVMNDDGQDMATR